MQNTTREISNLQYLLVSLETASCASAPFVSLYFSVMTERFLQWYL